MVALLPVLFMGTFLAGCGSSVPAASTNLHPGKAKTSVIEGLPVPEEATLIVRRQTPLESAEYVLVGVSLSSADSWYEKELPSGQPWNDWTWVSPTGPGCLNLFSHKGVSRTWARDSSMLTLNVMSGATGTGIVIEVLPKPNPGMPVC
jgi:hypothetical protein